MLKEMREQINRLSEKIEESERKQTEREFNFLKQEIVKNRKVIEKNQAEIEKLKQREETRLVEKRKSEPQPVIQPQITNFETVINTYVRLEFNQALGTLPPNQKQYYKTLKDYALKQPKASIRPTKYQLSIGVGIKPYIKFEVKRNTLFANFNGMEMKVDDEQAFEVAMQMIDSRVKEINNKN